MRVARGPQADIDEGLGQLADAKVVARPGAVHDGAGHGEQHDDDGDDDEREGDGHLEDTEPVGVVQLALARDGADPHGRAVPLGPLHFLRPSAAVADVPH